MRTDSPKPNSKLQEKLLLTRREVAEATGFCERTIYVLTKRGEIPSVRFGDRGVRYPVSAIESMIATKLAANS